MAEFTLLETVVYHRMLWAEVTEKGLEFKASADFWEEHKISPWGLFSECFPCGYSKRDCFECIKALAKYDTGLHANVSPVGHQSIEQSLPGRVYAVESVDWPVVRIGVT